MKRSHEPRNEDDSASQPEEALFDWPRQTGRLGRVMSAIHERERRLKVRRIRRQWAAAGLAVVLAAGWLAFHRADGLLGGGGAPGTARNVARIVVPERQTLPDGSLVELKGDAKLEVAYSEGERRVFLRRGEAHFEVMKEAGRVFVVDAGGVEFRAVGTAFAVQLNAKHVGMIVTEGRVAVTRAEAKESTALAIVEAGSQADVYFEGPVPAMPAVQALQPQELRDKLAWRVPRLELNEAPLSEVVAAFNRYGRVRLEIGDRTLEHVAISGIIRADNTAPLLRVLENNYGIQAEQGESDIVVLRARRRD